MRKNILKSLNWANYTIQLNPSIFSRDLIQTNLNLFWMNIVEKHLQENQHIMLLFRLQWANNQIVTIGNLNKLNIEDKEYILNKIIEEMENKSEYYLETSITSIIFSYGIRDGRAIEKVINTDIQYHLYHHHKLPITMDPLKYGKLIDRFEDRFVIQVNPKNVAVITQNEEGNLVKFFKSGELTYQYLDTY